MKRMTVGRRVIFALGLLVAVPSAWGWGCTGHAAVALIAEKHMSPHAQKMVREILQQVPISADLKRYCPQEGLDPLASSATWADDERTLRPETGAWHFLDIPRHAKKGDLSKFCPPGGCVMSAIAMELMVLRNADAPAQERADALRFLVHFVGDLHQPLHTSSNNDRGGNCVPVGFFGQEPMETNPRTEDYRPNLHGIWDTNILERFTTGETPQQIADDLNAKFENQIRHWQSGRVDVAAWIWEGHRLAEGTVYGQLPAKIPVEPAKEILSCADDDHVSLRMLALHEEVSDKYEQLAKPVVERQLAKAGARLAAVLNSLWP
jgi:hypothetical protein